MLTSRGSASAAMTLHCFVKEVCSYEQKLSALNSRGCCSGSGYLSAGGDLYVLACRFTDSQSEEAVTALILDVHLSGIYSSVVFRLCEAEPCIPNHVSELVKG